MDKIYKLPAEWEGHSSCWLAWPSHPELWQENLEGAQKEFVQLCRAIADIDPKSGHPRGERLHVLVRPGSNAPEQAREALQGLPISFYELPFGDIWLRDTGPLFLRDQSGLLATQHFAFNGWGAKYLLPHDPELSFLIAKQGNRPKFESSLVFEGGSIDVDGESSCLTTRDCLLNPNRNPGRSEQDIEGELKRTLGLEKVIWLEGALINDHTDGHVDTLARFCAPGLVLCMEPRDASDPNADVLNSLIMQLASSTDAKGRKLQVIKVPSPGTLLNDEGDLLPASYMNFYIGNSTVVVPTYGSDFDQQAVTEIARCFPNRRTVGLSAKKILSGGGAFHCITQQEPEENERNHG
ncbi:MAG: agmatine deiminase family protein [Oligoflexales bacterium]|nr:agmatine deiminase family protein [Oligoflexales bacterium]